MDEWDAKYTYVPPDPADWSEDGTLFQTSAAVRLCLRFSEDARSKGLAAEAALMRAQKEAERARDYLERTSNTLEQAIRLHAMGRT